MNTKIENTHRPLLVRLAHAVADYNVAKGGPRAHVFRQYLDGMRDAVTALGGPGDFTINMHAAYNKIGPRPVDAMRQEAEIKAWLELMLEEYEKLSNGWAIL